MSIIGDEREARISETFNYRITPFEFRGERVRALITDGEMDKILTYRGTGEVRLFIDVVREVYSINWAIMENEFETGIVTGAHLRYIDYIVKNDFRLIFDGFVSIDRSRAA